VFVPLLKIDPVVAKLPFLGSPWPAAFVVLGYLLIILKFGKKYMENRKPYDIKHIMIGYNIFQVVYNGILFSILGEHKIKLLNYIKTQLYFFLVHYTLISPTYNLSCMTTLPFDHPRKNLERAITYLYFVNKIIDLLDTIFFILRKSYKQITTLHVYHHVFMVLIPYCVVRFYGVGAQFATTAFLNTFVHSVMYFYYMVSAMYPGRKGILWWKKYITKMQLIQFVIGMFQSVYILMFNPACEYPIIFHFVIITGGFIFIAMFSNFYIKTYTMSQKHKLK
ncbi:hypothetical protein KR044_001652, partial [Drosophila immigrans]